LRCNKRQNALAVLPTLLLAGLLLPAMLTALTGILGLLAGLLLPAVLTALVRVALVLLILVALVRHFHALLAFAPYPMKTPIGPSRSGNLPKRDHITMKIIRIKGSKPSLRSRYRGGAPADKYVIAARANATSTPLRPLAPQWATRRVAALSGHC
jgi:hypothetical protein